MRVKTERNRNIMGMYAMVYLEYSTNFGVIPGASPCVLSMTGSTLP